MINFFSVGHQWLLFQTTEMAKLKDAWHMGLAAMVD